MRKRAEREGWESRERGGQGGGKERRRSALPVEAQAALLLKLAPRVEPAPRAAADRSELWRQYEARPDSAKEAARRRLDAVLAVERLVADGVAKLKAVTAAAQAEQALGRNVSEATLRRWLALADSVERHDRLARLVPRHRGRETTAEIAPEVWDWFLADFMRPERPAARACYERLKRVAAARGWPLPCERTLTRRIEREVPRQVVLLKRYGPNALARFGQPAQRRDRSVFHAVQAVCADFHTFDVRVELPDGRRVRMHLIAWQDLRSGKLLAWRLEETPNADGVRLSFGEVVEAWGVPDFAYFDNGHEFAAKWISGQAPWRLRFKRKAEEPIGVLTALGVEVHWARPRWGQAKPIERVFRDLCEYVAKHPAFSGAYLGNSPAAKPENYDERAIPLGDFIDVLAQEIQAYNARPGRRTQACGGKLSFDEAFAASFETAPIRRATEQQRRLWLLAAENVTARQDATLHIFGNRYWAEFAQPGQKYTIRFDPQQLHGGVHVYERAGGYRGFAACVEDSGYADAGDARAIAKLRRELARRTREQAEAQIRLTVAQAAAMLPAPPPAAPLEAKVVRPIRTPDRAAAAARLAPDDDREAGFIDLMDRISTERNRNRA